MTGTTAYILSKKIALGAVSGISDISLNDSGQLTFSLKNGTTATMNIPLPKDGTSIVDIDISDTNHLICTLSNNTTIDAGQINVPKSENIQFVDTFPSIGQQNVLYVKDNKFYKWDNNKKQYIEIITQGGTSQLQWVIF